MDTENVDAVRKEVRDHYGQLSREGMGCCGTGGCCAANPDASAALGCTAEQLADAPEGANLGLGCGNPRAAAMSARALRMAPSVRSRRCSSTRLRGLPTNDVYNAYRSSSRTAVGIAPSSSSPTCLSRGSISGSLISSG